MRKRKEERTRKRIIHYFEEYLIKLADDYEAYSVVLRAIHRKVFLKRTNHKTGQKTERERKRGRRGKERKRGIEEKINKKL